MYRASTRTPVTSRSDSIGLTSYELNASTGGQEQIRLRSPRALSIRPTGGHTLGRSTPFGDTAPFGDTSLVPSAPAGNAASSRL